ncbi:hypothetical protein [Streptomyces sp. NBC_01589]|uniref:hypothetical protein n=1 Tax=unclassified Streptomyces TaxID=2593676 RepID=UPI00386F6D99
MLDLLLQRIPDAPLWKSDSLAFVVLDEFHTYDGAQGTDVAMLLRRLGAATGVAREGRPLGDITPVATSATLGGGMPSGSSSLALDGPERSDRELLREFSEKVFGTPFPDAALIGEDRLLPGEVVTDPDFLLPSPAPAALAALPDPLDYESALVDLTRLMLGQPLSDPVQIGARLKQHILVKAILDVAGSNPVAIPDIAREFARRGGGPAWDEAARSDPRLVELAFARILALISHARTPHPSPLTPHPSPGDGNACSVPAG